MTMEQLLREYGAIFNTPPPAAVPPSGVGGGGASPASPTVARTGDPAADALAAVRARIAEEEAELAAEQGLIPLTQAQIDARRGTVAPTRASIAARGDVVDAQAGLTAADRAFIAEERRANEQRTAAEERIQAARRDVEGILAAGEEQQYRNDTAYRSQAAGITPMEVDLPEDLQGTKLPAYARIAVRTPEELATGTANEQEALRALQLDQARLAVDTARTDVAAAEQIAARAGLSLEEAQLLVFESNVNLDQGQLNVKPFEFSTRRARLAEEEAGLVPSGMMLWADPYTGATRYVTRAEYDRLEKEYDAATGGGEGGHELSKLSVDSIANLIAQRKISLEEGIAVLVSKGYSRRAAELELGEAGQNATAEEVLDAIEKGTMTFEQGVARLRAAGMTTDEINLILDEDVYTASQWVHSPWARTPGTLR